MLSTLLIRVSKGKVTGVTGMITGCGQQANERARQKEAKSMAMKLGRVMNSWSQLEG